MSSATSAEKQIILSKRASRNQIKPPRPVRVVNYETNQKSDYEETSSDSETCQYVYNIKTQNQRIKKTAKGSST